MLNSVADKNMKTLVKYSLLILITMITIWSCSKASGHGTFTLILSGSVHGQLDPCG